MTDQPVPRVRLWDKDFNLISDTDRPECPVCHHITHTGLCRTTVVSGPPADNPSNVAYKHEGRLVEPCNCSHQQ